MKSSKTARKSTQATGSPSASSNDGNKSTTGMTASQRILRDSKQLTGKTSQRTSTPIGRGVTRKRRLDETQDLPGKKPRKKLLDGNNPDASLFNSELSVIEQHDSPTKHTRSSKSTLAAPQEQSTIHKSSRSYTVTSSKVKKGSPSKMSQKERKSFTRSSKGVKPKVSKKSTRARRLDDSLLSKKKMNQHNGVPCLSIPVYRNKPSNVVDASASRSLDKDLGVDCLAKSESQNSEAVSPLKHAPTRSPLRKPKQRFMKSPRRSGKLPDKHGVDKPGTVSQKDGDDFSKHDFSPGVTKQRIQIDEEISILHSVSSESSNLEVTHPQYGSSTEASTGDSTYSIIDMTVDTSSSVDQSSYSLRRSHQPIKEENLSKMIKKSESVQNLNPEPRVIELFSPPKTDGNKPRRTETPCRRSSRSDHDASKADKVQEHDDSRVTRSSPSKITNEKISNPQEPVSSVDANATRRKIKMKESVTKSKETETSSIKSSNIHKHTVTAQASKDIRKNTRSQQEIIDKNDSGSKQAAATEARSDPIQKGSSKRLIPMDTDVATESRKTRSGKASNVQDDLANEESLTSPGHSPQNSRRLRSSDAPGVISSGDLSQNRNESVDTDPRKLKASVASASKNLSHQIDKMRSPKTNEVGKDDDSIHHPLPLRYILQKNKHRNQIKKKINDIVDSLEFASDDESVADLVGMASSSIESHPEESSLKSTDASDDMDSMDDPDEIFLKQSHLPEEPSESSLELKSTKSQPPKKKLKVLFPRKKGHTSSRTLNSTSESEVQFNISQNSSSIDQFLREAANGVIQQVPKDATKRTQRRTSPRRGELKCSTVTEDAIEPYHSPVEDSQRGITLRSSRRLTCEDSTLNSTDSISESSTLEHPYGKIQVVVISDTSSETQNSSRSSLMSDSRSKELNQTHESISSNSRPESYDPLIVARTDLMPLSKQKVQKNQVRDGVQLHQGSDVSLTDASSDKGPRLPLITDPIFSKPQDRLQKRSKNMVDSSSQNHQISRTGHHDQNTGGTGNSDSAVKPGHISKSLRPTVASSLPNTVSLKIVQQSNLPQPITQQQVPAVSTNTAAHIPFIPILPGSVIQGPFQSFPQATIAQQRLVPGSSLTVQQGPVTATAIPMISPVITQNLVVNTVPQLIQNIPTVLQQTQPFTVIRLPTDQSVLNLTSLPVPQTVPVLLPQRSLPSQASLAPKSVNEDASRVPNNAKAKTVTALPQRPTVITKPTVGSPRVQATSSKTYSAKNSTSSQLSETVISSSGAARTQNVALTEQTSGPVLEMNQSTAVAESIAPPLVPFNPIKNEPMTSATASIEEGTPDKYLVLACSDIVKDEPMGIAEAGLMEKAPVSQPTGLPDETIIKNEPVLSSEPPVLEAVPVEIENVRSLNLEEDVPIQTSDAVLNVPVAEYEAPLESEAIPTVQDTAGPTDDVEISNSLPSEDVPIVQQPSKDAQDATMPLTIRCAAEVQAAVELVSDPTPPPESVNMFAEDTLEDMEDAPPLSGDQFADLMDECSKIVSPMKTRSEVEDVSVEPSSTVENADPCISESTPAKDPQKLSDKEPSEKEGTSSQAKATPKSSDNGTTSVKGSESKSKLKKKSGRKQPVPKSDKSTKRSVIEIPKGETARTIITKPSYQTRYERIDSASLNHKKKKRWILNTEFESLYRKVKLDQSQILNTNVTFINNLIEKTNELTGPANDDDDANNDDDGEEVNDTEHITKESSSKEIGKSLPKSVKDKAKSKKKKTKNSRNKTASIENEPMNIHESADLHEDSIELVQKNNSVSASASQEKPSTSSKTSKRRTEQTESIDNNLSVPSVTKAKRAKKTVVAPQKTPVSMDKPQESSILNEDHPTLKEASSTQDINGTTKKKQSIPTTEKTLKTLQGSASKPVVTTSSQLAKTTSIITELKKTSATIAQLAQTTTNVTSVMRAPTMSVAMTTLPTMMTPVVPRFLPATTDIPPPKGRRISRVKLVSKPPDNNSVVEKHSDLSIRNNNNNKNNHNRESTPDSAVTIDQISPTLFADTASSSEQASTSPTANISKQHLKPPKITNKDFDPPDASGVTNSHKAIVSAKDTSIANVSSVSTSPKTKPADLVTSAKEQTSTMLDASEKISSHPSKQPPLPHAPVKTTNRPPEETTKETVGLKEPSSKPKPRSRRSSGKASAPAVRSSPSKPTLGKEPSSSTLSGKTSQRQRTNSSKSAAGTIPEITADVQEPVSHKADFLKSLSLTSSLEESMNDSSLAERTNDEDEDAFSNRKGSSLSSKDHSPSSKPFSKEDLSQTESNVSRILKQIELRQQTDQHAADVHIPQKITPDKSKKSRSRSNFHPAEGSRKSSRHLKTSPSTKTDPKSQDSKSSRTKALVIDKERSSEEHIMDPPSKSKSSKKKSKNMDQVTDPEFLHESSQENFTSTSSSPPSSHQKSLSPKKVCDSLMKSPENPVRCATFSPKRISQKDTRTESITSITLPIPQDSLAHSTESTSHVAPTSPSSSIPNTDQGYSSQSLSRSSSISDISNRSFSKPKMVQKTLFDFNIGDRRKSAPPRPLIAANERRITRTIIIYDETTGAMNETSDGACQTMVEDLERTFVRKISKSVVVCDSSCQTSDLPFTNMVNGTVCESPQASGHTSIGTSPIKQPQTSIQQSTDASTGSPMSKGSSTGPDTVSANLPKKSTVSQSVLNEYERIIAQVASNIPESPASSPVSSKKADLRKKVLKKSGKKCRQTKGEDSTMTSATESDLEDVNHQSESNICSPDHSVVLSDVDQTMNIHSSPGYQSSLKLSEEMMSSNDETASLPEEIEFGATTDEEEDDEAESKLAQRKSRRMIVKLPGLTPKKNQGSPEKSRTSNKLTASKSRKRIRSPASMESSRKRLMLDPEASDAEPLDIEDLQSDPESMPVDVEQQEQNVGEQNTPPRKGAKTKKKKLRGRPCKKSNRGRKPTIRDDSEEEGDENAKMVKCLNCDEEFSCLKDLKMHMMMTHSKLYTAAQPEGVGDHAALRYILKKCGRLVCTDCGKSHRNIQYYTFHQKWCGKEEETTVCLQCNRSVQTMWLQQHYREHRNREHFQGQKTLSPPKKNEVVDGKRLAALRARTNLQDLTKELMMPDSNGDSGESVMGDGEYVGVSDSESSESDLSVVPERADLSLGHADPGFCKKSFGDNQLPTQPDLFEDIVHFYQNHSRVDNLHKILLPVKDDWIALSEESWNEFIPKYQQSVQFMVSQHRYEEKRKVSKPMILDWSQSFVTKDQTTSYCGGAIDSIEWCPLPIFKPTNQYAAVACHMTRDQPIGFFNPPESYSMIHIWSFGVINPFLTKVKPTLSLSLVHDFNIASTLCWCPHGTWQNPAEPVEVEDVHHRLGLLAVGSVDGNVRIFSVPHPFEEEDAEEGSEVKPPKLYQPNPSMILKTIEHSGTGACMAVSWQNTTSCDNIIAGYANGVVRIWNITATSPLLVSYTESGIKIVHPIKSFFAHNRPIRDIAWNPKDGNIFATSGDDKKLRIWKLDSLYKEIDVVVVGTPVTSLAWPLMECGLVFGKDNIYLNDRSHTGFHDCGMKPNVLRYSPTNHHGAIVDVEFSDWHNVVLSCDTYGSIKGARFRDTSFEEINVHAVAHREFTVYMTDIRSKKAVRISTDDLTSNSQTNQSSPPSSLGNQTSSASSQNSQTSTTLSGNSLSNVGSSKTNETSSSLSQNTVSSETPAECQEADVANENGDVNQVTNTDQSTTSKKKVDKYDYHSYKDTDEKCCLEFIDYPLTEVKAGRKKKISGKIDIKKLSCFPIESLRSISVSKNVFGSTWLLSGGEAGLLRLHNMSGVMADTGRLYMEDKIPKES